MTATRVNTSINPSCGHHPPSASVGTFLDGQFVIAWNSCNTHIQKFFADGTKKGSAFQISSDTNSGQFFPTMGTFPGGKLVVAWIDNKRNLWCVIFADGAKEGHKFQITTDEYTSTPAIGTFPDGNFVVVWSVIVNGRFDVCGQRYSSEGKKEGNKFSVNSYTYGTQKHPAIGTFSDGSFVVVWESQYQDGSENGIFVQKFYGNGTKEDSEFRVNSYTEGNQDSPAIGTFPDGRLAVVWNSRSAVFGQMFQTELAKIEVTPTCDNNLDLRADTIETAPKSLHHIDSNAATALGVGLLSTMLGVITIGLSLEFFD